MEQGNNKLNIDIDQVNKLLQGKAPIEIIQWALNMAEKPILTTNFGPYSASLIHAVTTVDKDINVIWCDTGYNTSQTYRYALSLIDKLELKMHIYTPRLSAGFRNVRMGIPQIDTPEHKLFTEEVKLEPFKRALEEHQPDVWFTNLRSYQSEHRKNLDILHINKDGILKVSPFFHYSEKDIELYLEKFALPNEKRYYDPTKVLTNRECGLHL